MENREFLVVRLVWRLLVVCVEVERLLKNCG